MNWIRLGTTLVNLALQYPVEKHMKPDHSGSEQALAELRQSTITITPEETTSPAHPLIDTAVEAPFRDEIELPEVVKREQGGDYCLSCVPSKHLMKAKDGLTDALNILSREGKFTKVAEDKVQVAVYNLNGAEDDLELARVSQVIKPAVDEMKVQVGRIRNFLRSDQSGLETGTLLEDIEEAREDLRAGIEVVDNMIKAGYELTKLQLKERANAIRERSS